MAGLSDARLYLLSLFLKPRSAGTITAHGWNERWREVLKDDPSAVLSKFVEAGLLAPATIAETLECVMDVKRLKEALRVRQQKLSGKKRDLIARLLAADPEACRALASGNDVFVCTVAGDEAACRYVNDRETRRELAEAKTLAALKKYRPDDAVGHVHAFQRTEVFPPGIGFSAEALAKIAGEQLARLYNGGVPAIVGKLSHEDSETLLTAAALMLLGMDAVAKRYMASAKNFGARLSPEVAVRMCVFAARHRRKRQQLEEAGIEWVQVAGVNDGNGCSVCEALRGRKFRLSKAPELPLADCTCEAGCRCTLLMADRPWSLFG